MNSNYSLLSHANAFSAGIFISLALIHLLPEAEGSFKVYFSEDGDHSESSLMPEDDH